MQFRSVSDLNRDILRNLDRLPRDLDLVVGIPRSGLLAATLISLARNVSLTDVEGFIADRILSSGKTRGQSSLKRAPEAARHVLVVDDSIFSGSALREARSRLSGLYPGQSITFCAVYGSGVESDGVADLVLEVLATPRMFEWNVMHHNLLSRACVDIDGILCVDPSHNENDDGEAYMRFLQNARPLHLPTRCIGELVTSRLEKYRLHTEAWLREQGIMYERLIMLDLPDAATRRRLNAHATFKGRHYRASDAWIFIESERLQAERIAAISGKPVLWLGGPEMFHPKLSSPAGAIQIGRRAEVIKKPLKRIVGDQKYNELRALLRKVL